jgi:hypothetical protein
MNDPRLADHVAVDIVNEVLAVMDAIVRIV